jgi:hypothetical protein
MKLEQTAIAISVLVGLLSSACCKGNPPATTPAPAKDSEVRTYIRDELGPYLDALAKQVCIVKEDAAPQAELVEGVCTGDPEGYKPPPKDGNP